MEIKWINSKKRKLSLKFLVIIVSFKVYIDIVIIKLYL